MEKLRISLKKKNNRKLEKIKLFRSKIIKITFNESHNILNSIFTKGFIHRITSLIHELDYLLYRCDHE